MLKRRFKDENENQPHQKNGKMQKIRQHGVYDEILNLLHFIPYDLVSLITSFVSISNYLNVHRSDRPISIGDSSIRQMLNENELNADEISNILIRTGAKLTGSSILHNLWIHEDDPNMKDLINNQIRNNRIKLAVEIKKIHDNNNTFANGLGLFKLAAEIKKVGDDDIAYQPNDWINNDFDFFVLDSSCDDKKFKCELDDYLESLTIDIISKQSIKTLQEKERANGRPMMTYFKERMEEISSSRNWISDNDTDNNDDKFKPINTYIGGSKVLSKEFAESKKCLYLSGSGYEPEKLENTNNGENVWKQQKEYHIKGVLGNRKYNFPFFSVDVVYVDSKLYPSVDDFINDTFDFDFLKNSWNGTSVKIMRPIEFKLRQSRCLQPLPTITMDAHTHYFTRESYLDELELGYDQDDGRGIHYFNHLDNDEAIRREKSAIEWWNTRIQRRRIMYMERGFTIID